MSESKTTGIQAFHLNSLQCRKVVLPITLLELHHDFFSPLPNHVILVDMPPSDDQLFCKPMSRAACSNVSLLVHYNKQVFHLNSLQCNDKVLHHDFFAPLPTCVLGSQYVYKCWINRLALNSWQHVQFTTTNTNKLSMWTSVELNSQCWTSTSQSTQIRTEMDQAVAHAPSRQI